jgi:hypothetical protein
VKVSVFDIVNNEVTKTINNSFLHINSVKTHF